MDKAGFSNISIETREVPKEYAAQWAQSLKVGEYIMSATIKATKE